MEDTIAAISTSTVSSGAISIVRISGPDAIIIGDKVFKSKRILSLQMYRVIRYILEIYVITVMKLMKHL